jgi:hypothetical protein
MIVVWWRRLPRRATEQDRVRDVARRAEAAKRHRALHGADELRAALRRRAAAIAVSHGSGVMRPTLRYGQRVLRPAFARQNCRISSVMSMSQLLSDPHGGALPFLPGH